MAVCHYLAKQKVKILFFIDDKAFPMPLNTTILVINKYMREAVNNNTTTHPSIHSVLFQSKKHNSWRVISAYWDLYKWWPYTSLH